MSYQKNNPDIFLAELRNGLDLPEDIDVTWDEFYDDPDAKLVLISSDNIGFKVQARVLAKKSTFIKDLLEVPSDEPVATIHIDHTAAVVRVFIDMVLTRCGTHLGVDLAVDSYNELFQLSDRFDTPSLPRSILASLLAQMRSAIYPGSPDSWEAFVLAARYDDEALAIAAVKNSAKNGYTHKQMFYESPREFIFSGLPPKYAVALHRHAFCTTYSPFWYDSRNKRGHEVSIPGPR